MQELGKQSKQSVEERLSKLEKDIEYLRKYNPCFFAEVEETEKTEETKESEEEKDGVITGDDEGA